MGRVRDATPVCRDESRHRSLFAPSMRRAAHAGWNFAVIVRIRPPRNGRRERPQTERHSMNRNDSNVEGRALYRNAILVLLLLSIALIVHNIFGQNGYLTLRQQRKEAQDIEQKIKKLQDENEQLGKQNRELKSNPEAIERMAREQMHLAKPGEKIYTLPEKAPASQPAPAANPAQPQP